jgi:hypothetical protein
LVAVPESVPNAEQMGWIANDVLDAGGEAHLWTAELQSVKQDRELVARLNREVSGAYREFAAAADEAMAGEDVGPRQRDRFKRELRDIVRRDHVGATGRDRAERALQKLTRAAATL